MKGATSLFVFVIAMLVAAFFVVMDRSSRDNTPARPQPTPYAGAVLLNVSELKGQSAPSVEQILGPAGGEETTVYGTKRTYRNGEVEIVYINDKADWITYTPQQELPFGPETLTALGLPITEPTEKTPSRIRWENTSDFLSISLVPKENGLADYFFFQAVTPVPGSDVEVQKPTPTPAAQ